MLRKKIIFSCVLISLLALAGTEAFAQTFPVGGKVEMKLDDGTTVAVQKAKVDCYRTDTAARCRSTETNSRGEFTFLGIPVNGMVAFAVSGEGINPVVFPNVRANSTDVVILVTKGVGEPLTEEEVREQVALFTANPTGELTEEQRKAQAEYEKKVAEITAKNKKIEEKNALVERVLKEGNTAYNAGDYDLAIVKYEEGVQADPDFVGSAPVLLNNKGAALKQRAVNVYNTAAKTNNGPAIVQAKIKAGKDLSDSLSSYHKAHQLLAGAKTGEIIDAAKHKQDKFNALDGARDAIRIMVLIKIVDGELTDAAKEATAAYIEAETDKNKQAQAQSNMAAYLFEGGDFDGSVEEYRKAYTFSPKDPDVLAKFSLALFTVGEDKQDKAMKQESLNYMEVYLSNAPKDHNLRNDIAGLANYLKTNEKLKPQKVN